VTTAKRIAILPDVPTLQELGLKGYEAGSWNAVFVAAGTPAPVVKKLADSLEMAPLSPTGKVSKHTKETQSLTDCLRYIFFGPQRRAGDLHVITHRLSCVQEANPHVLDDEFIYRFIYTTDCILEIYYRSPYVTKSLAS
jgi:hypothetical protein